MTSTAVSAPTPLRATSTPVNETAKALDNRSGWLFATPFLVLYTLFLIGPVVIGLVISLFNTATVRSGFGDWVGARNYSAVLSSSDFWASMWHSTLFTLITTPLLVVLPLL